MGMTDLHAACELNRTVQGTPYPSGRRTLPAQTLPCLRTLCCSKMKEAVQFKIQEQRTETQGLPLGFLGHTTESSNAHKEQRLEQEKGPRAKRLSRDSSHAAQPLPMLPHWGGLQDLPVPGGGAVSHLSQPPPALPEWTHQHGGLTQHCRSKAGPSHPLQ
jgi:hypothetical protein